MKLEEMKRTVVETIVGSKYVINLDNFGERDASMVDRIMKGFQIVETGYFQRIALLDPNATFPLNKEKVIGQFATEFTLGGSQVNGETLIDLWKETCAQFKANDIKKIGKEILSLIEKFNTDKGTKLMADKMKAMHVKQPHWVNFQKELPELKWVTDFNDNTYIIEALESMINEGLPGVDGEGTTVKYMRIFDFISQVPNSQAPGVLAYFDIPSLPVKTPEQIGEEIEFAVNVRLLKQLTPSMIRKTEVLRQKLSPSNLEKGCNCGKLGCPSNKEDTDFIDLRQKLINAADLPALLKEIKEMTQPKTINIELGDIPEEGLDDFIKMIKANFPGIIDLSVEPETKEKTDEDKLLDLWMKHFTETNVISAAAAATGCDPVILEKTFREQLEGLRKHVKTFYSQGLVVTTDDIPSLKTPNTHDSATGYENLLSSYMWGPQTEVDKASEPDYILALLALDFNRGKPTSEDPLAAAVQQQVDRYNGSHPGKLSGDIDTVDITIAKAIIDKLKHISHPFEELFVKRPYTTQINSSSHTVLNQDFIVYDLNGDFFCEYKMIWAQGKVRIMYSHVPAVLGESRRFNHIMHNHKCTEQEAIGIFANLRESAVK